MTIFSFFLSLLYLIFLSFFSLIFLSLLSNLSLILSNTHFFLVLVIRSVPPTIIEEETSSDIAVDERNPLSLKCRGRGYPSPAVTWRREDGRELHLETFAGKEMPGQSFSFLFLFLSFRPKERSVLFFYFSFLFLLFMFLFLF